MEKTKSNDLKIHRKQRRVHKMTSCRPETCRSSCTAFILLTMPTSCPSRLIALRLRLTPTCLHFSPTFLSYTTFSSFNSFVTFLFHAIFCSRDFSLTWNTSPMQCFYLATLLALRFFSSGKEESEAETGEVAFTYLLWYILWFWVGPPPLSWLTPSAIVRPAAPTVRHFLLLRHFSERHLSWVKYFWFNFSACRLLDPLLHPWTRSAFLLPLLVDCLACFVGWFKVAQRGVALRVFCVPTGRRRGGAV